LVALLIIEIRMLRLRLSVLDFKELEKREEKRKVGSGMEVTLNSWEG
jgi:hypothetical protein